MYAIRSYYDPVAVTAPKPAPATIKAVSTVTNPKTQNSQSTYLFAIVIIVALFGVTYKMRKKFIR